jgi:repressor LexA
MYEDLNKRQQQVLDYIKKFVREKGYPPSVREIGKAIGLSSSSTVHNHLTQLEKKGYIRKDPTKPRAIEILEGNANYYEANEEIVKVPVLGKITAGEPILAVENAEETIPLPISLTGGDSVFILNVRGESMIEAGILDGDKVIVKRQSTATNGDIVVALLDEEATVKRFYKEKDHVRLQPENSSMAPIIAKDVKVLGKVIGVFRKVY